MNKLLGMHKVLGIAFLALLLLAGYLVYAVFTKKFSTYDEVTLKTSSIGLQLPKRADIKVRGVIVGEVLDFKPTADGADVTLGMYPDHIDAIPANVTGTILPKTLFGEKYVDLVIPDKPAGTLVAGAVITKSAMGTEVEKVLADLYPLLQTVAPEQLNMTLSALATALDGRGEQLGENLETIDAYLKRINPQIPQLVEDLRLTHQVADIYSDVLPEVATILDNTIKTTTTLESREDKVRKLFQDVTALSGSVEKFLDENGELLIESGELNTKVLRVLSRYSPEIPCLTKGLVNANKLEAEAFRNFKLHIILETLPRQPRRYTAKDVPVIGEDRGPNCLHLPNPPWSQENPNKRVPNFNDGVDEPTGKGTSRVAPGELGDVDTSGLPTNEWDFYRELVAPSMGMLPEDVSDLGPFLLAPMARGSKVSVE